MASDKISSKMDTLIKLVLVFFIALLSFSIGTFVGKKFSDNQHRLAQLEPTSPESKDERAPASNADHDSGEKSETLTDQEVAKLAEEFVNDEINPSPNKDSHNAEGSGHDAHGAVAHEGDTHSSGGEHDKSDSKEQGKGKHETAEHKEDAKSKHDDGEHKEDSKNKHKTSAHSEEASSKHETADHKENSEAHGHEKLKSDKHDTASAKGNKSSHEEKSSEHKEVSDSHHGSAKMSHEEEAPVKEHRKPASLSKEIISNPVGKYTLQLASYPNETEAQKMTDELKEKGFSAFYISAQVKDKSWYRVSVGLFATQKEALSHKADLMEKTKVNSAIIQKITQPF